MTFYKPFYKVLYYIQFDHILHTLLIDCINDKQVSALVSIEYILFLKKRQIMSK